MHGKMMSQSFIMVTHHQFRHYTRFQMKGRPWHCMASFNIKRTNSSTMEAVLPISEFYFKWFKYLRVPHTSSAVICIDTTAEHKKCGKTLLSTSGIPRGGLGCSNHPPSPEILKIPVETSITQARRTGVSISFCSSLCSHIVVIY